MDMNWIDEIRDPEPRKRYIYNADDYDPQYGDPYYREHSTRADSLWRLYEESGTSITFDAFADESRQTDYRMETGALRDFFNGYDGSVEVEIRQDCPCDAPALVDLWKHRLRSRYAESSAD